MQYKLAKSTQIWIQRTTNKMAMSRMYKILLVLSGVCVCLCWYFSVASNTNNLPMFSMGYGIENRKVSFIEKTEYNERIEDLNSASLYSNGRYWKKDEPISDEDSTGNEKFVIFDSSDYSGTLTFLDNPLKGWIVFVVNHKDKSQLRTCNSCKSFTTSSDASNILENLRNKKIYTITLAAMAKMAAYLYAHSQNASWIYVTDKLVPVPFHILTKVTNRQLTKGMVYQGPNPVFQPCGHFMDTFTWNGRSFLKNQSRYVLRSLPKNFLYQIVDSCYRPGMPSDWQTLLDRQAPTPFVMPGVWTAVDFNNILVPRNAFWTLVASMSGKTMNPISYPSQGHLSMVVQRLLWETQTVIGFVPGTVGLQECPTCVAENALNRIGPAQAVTLTKWSCDPEREMVTCIQTIVASGLIGTGRADDIKQLDNLVSTWAQFLKEYKITIEKRTPLNDKILNATNIGNSIYFTPAKSLHKGINRNGSLPPNAFREVCGKDGKPYSAFIPDRHPKLFEKVLLVISFNVNKFMSIVNYLEYLFGRHFKHILYCATGKESFEDDYMKSLNANPVSFVDVDVASGHYGYFCAVAAMEMNYDVMGYLYMSDDVMINMWNMHHHPFHMPWFQTDIRVVNMKSTFTRGHDFGVDWYPWNHITGKPAITESMEILKAFKNDSRDGARVTWFLKNVADMASCDNCIAYMDADLYYIPAYMASDFQFFIPFFKGVFQELSIPTILSGITPKSDLNIYRLRGYYLVGANKRNNFEKAWSEEELFIHPVKLSALGKSPKHNDFYCHVVRRSDQDLSVLQH